MAVHRLIHVVGDTHAPQHIVCPSCGERENFRVFSLHDRRQSMVQDDAGNRSGYEDVDGPGGDFLCLEIAIACGHCDATIMERPITITVPPWQHWQPRDDSLQPDPALRAWHIFGQYPDSLEDHYDTYVLMPQDWTEEQVQAALIARAEAEGDTALTELLAETATFERVAHQMVDGQLYVPAATTHAVYR